MHLKRLAPAFALAILIFASGCGGSDSTTDTAATPTESAEAVVEPTQAVVEPTQVVSDQDPAAPTPPGVAFVGEWPNRFCVDGSKVESTLNLRSAPSTDSEVLASVPRSSCDLVLRGLTLDNGFQPVTYTTSDGAVEGWVSNEFVEFQNPPSRIEAAALLFVGAWQVGVDTGQYSYGIDTLPTPILGGNPVPVEGSAGFGCVLEGDVTVVCAVALVEANGTEIARMTLTGTQRGTNGNEGEPYFPADFPDGPTITSFMILDS